MPFVLDASVAAAWAFEDETTPYTDRMLAMFDRDTALVPAIWPLEIANTALAGERRGRLGVADVVAFAGLLKGLPIEVAQTTVASALDITVDVARSHALSAYDASYLELAMREGIPLATQDRRLREAAERAGVIIA
jgi:predicted nucleic acid-binding protein